MTLNKYGFLALSILALVATARAESELDGQAKAPAIIVSELNAETKTVTNYKVETLDASVQPSALEGLSESEREARVQSFLKSAVRPENKISEEKVEKVSSELDSDGSTSAHYWRWRGCHSRNYYGYGFNAYYGSYNYYYRPAWNYGYYGYYGGGYRASYYPRYNGCYYTAYSYYGW
jgi:hypothetical protein